MPIDVFKDPELDTRLASEYPHYSTQDWTGTNWLEDECSDTVYNKEVDNFPALTPEGWLYLEAVFYIIPARHLLLIETYTTLFEAFPELRPECKVNEILFLTRLASDSAFGLRILSQLAPHHPFRSCHEIVTIFEYWQATQRLLRVTGGSGRIIFPPRIRDGILQAVSNHLQDTPWQVCMLEQFQGNI
ncbi:MAG: hypothetical protein ACW98I_20855 [Candidatus Hodarchaeales archaeon]|jgi:hypothetical protein